jgi:hypothetical protein
LEWTHEAYKFVIVQVNWIALGMNNTFPIAQTKIIEPMVFIDYSKHDFFSLIGFGMVMQSRLQ